MYNLQVKSENTGFYFCNLVIRQGNNTFPYIASGLAGVTSKFGSMDMLVIRSRGCIKSGDKIRLYGTSISKILISCTKQGCYRKLITSNIGCEINYNIVQDTFFRLHARRRL